jgi:hypothetical protein
MGKLILYMDPVKCVRLDSALGSLKGTRLLDTLCVYVDTWAHYDGL